MPWIPRSMKCSLSAPHTEYSAGPHTAAAATQLLGGSVNQIEYAAESGIEWETHHAGAQQRHTLRRADARELATAQHVVGEGSDHAQDGNGDALSTEDIDSRIADAVWQPEYRRYVAE